MKYRKKPVVVEAICYNGSNHEMIFYWAKEHLVATIYKQGTNEIVIPTLEGDHVAKPGDYIVKGVKGEFYPCKPDIFEMTYEEFDLHFKNCEHDANNMECRVSVASSKLVINKNELIRVREVMPDDEFAKYISDLLKTRSETFDENARLQRAVSEAKEILQKADNLKCKHMTEASEWLSRHGDE